MKKLFSTILVLGLLLSTSAYTEEKIILPEFIKKSVNAHVRAGFKIVDVSTTDKIVVYTLHKKQTVKVCYLILGTASILDCVYPWKKLLL